MDGAADRFAPAPDWRGRVPAFLRAVLFAVLFVLGGAAVNAATAPFQDYFPDRDGRLFVMTAFMAVTAIALTVLLAPLGGRHFASYGLGARRRGISFGAGAALGFGLLSAQLVLMHFLGVFDFGTGRPADLSLAADAARYAAIFLAVGVFEETLFRGYVLVELSRAISFWPAAILLAAGFGLPHALESGNSVLGGINAGLFGLVMAVAFRQSGSLWLPIGYHAAWDFGESFVYGVPDSGATSPGRLLHPGIHGADWLSGGSAGPEGSVLAVLPIVALLAYLLMRRKPRAAAITG